MVFRKFLQVTGISLDVAGLDHDVGAGGIAAGSVPFEGGAGSIRNRDVVDRARTKGVPVWRDGILIGAVQVEGDAVLRPSAVMAEPDFRCCKGRCRQQHRYKGKAGC
ncbi:MAG: hypothetical protein OXF20_15700 [Gammaproteobacteria bacterium]|nr:hypothetical protein [Gammaproteobacteria bacterium]